MSFMTEFHKSSWMFRAGATITKYWALSSVANINLLIFSMKLMNAMSHEELELHIIKTR